MEKLVKKFSLIFVSIFMLIIAFSLCACDDNDEPVLPEALDFSKITVADITEEFSFTGESIYPEPVVKYGEETLEKGINYTLSYENNIEVGEGEVTVLFHGKYIEADMVTKKFTIVPVALTEAMVTVIDNGQKINGVGSLEVVVKLGDNLVDASNYSVSFSTSIYAGEGVATITALENASITGSVTKAYTLSGYKGASKTMNAEVNAIDGYKGQEMEVKATTENDKRGLWYKAELTEEGLYVVAKAVADNYIHDDTYVAGMNPGAQASRHTYFEFFINNGTTQVFTYGGEGSINEDKIETRQHGNKIFDFLVWRTVENEGVTTGGKYTHIVEGFISSEKLTETDKYVGVAYSSGFNPNPVYDTDGQTVILPRGHIEKLTVNSGSVTQNDDRGYFHGLALSKTTLSQAMTITADGIALKKVTLGTITHDGKTEASWDTSANFGFTATKENFVQVVEYDWDMQYTFANNNGTWTCTNSAEGASVSLFVGANVNGTVKLAFPVDFSATNGVKVDTSTTTNIWSMDGVDGSAVKFNASMARMANVVRLMKEGKFKVVFVRDGGTLNIYATFNETGDGLTVISSNPLTHGKTFNGVLFRKRTHASTLTASASVVYGTTDYESVLSTYYAE